MSRRPFNGRPLLHFHADRIQQAMLEHRFRDKLISCPGYMAGIEIELVSLAGKTIVNIVEACVRRRCFADF
jgi:hypothetical protein